MSAVRAAFPYTVVTVNGRDAYEEWQRLRTAGDGWPIIVGSDEEFDRVAEQFSIDDPKTYPGLATELMEGIRPREIAEIIASAASIQLPEKFRELFEEEYGDGAVAPESGDWPLGDPMVIPELAVVSDVLTGRMLDRVNIVVVPTADFAEVPAYLRWGAWNACPAPEVHVAALRRWREQWGAELVGMTGDVLNLTVSRRPQSPEAAMELARELYFYCPDIVDQGTEYLEPLAASLMNSNWWFFWWD